MLFILKAIEKIDAFNAKIARVVAWLMPSMALLTFAIVILRYFLSAGWIWTSELVIYFHAVLFMLACGYTLFQDKHVRVDIFYREMSPRSQATIDLLGTCFLLIPFCLCLFIYSLPYVIASWQIWEGSPETGGLPIIFLLKTLIPFMSLSLFLQGVSLATRTALVLFGKRLTILSSHTKP